MKESTYEIDQKLCGDESNENGSGADMVLEGLFSKFPPKIKSEGHVGRLEGALGVGVVVFPEILFFESYGWFWSWGLD